MKARTFFLGTALIIIAAAALAAALIFAQRSTDERRAKDELCASLGGWRYNEERWRANGCHDR